MKQQELYLKQLEMQNLQEAARRPLQMQDLGQDGPGSGTKAHPVTAIATERLSQRALYPNASQLYDQTRPSPQLGKSASQAIFTQQNKDHSLTLTESQPALGQSQSNQQSLASSDFKSLQQTQSQNEFTTFRNSPERTNGTENVFKIAQNFVQ